METTVNSERTSFAFGLAASALAALVAATLAVRWSAPLAGFGPGLPASAALARTLAPWLFLLPGGVALLWALGAPGKRKGGLAVGLGALALVLAVASIAAMYLPLFKLSAAL